MSAYTSTSVCTNDVTLRANDVMLRANDVRGTYNFVIVMSYVRTNDVSSMYKLFTIDLRLLLIHINTIQPQIFCIPSLESLQWHTKSIETKG